jgi:hypothetical protein
VRLLFAQLVAVGVLQSPYLSRPPVVGDNMSKEGGGLQHYHSHQTFFFSKFNIPTSNMPTISRSYKLTAPWSFESWLRANYQSFN